MYVGQTYRINVSGNYKWSSANKRILRSKGKEDHTAKGWKNLYKRNQKGKKEKRL